MARLEAKLFVRDLHVGENVVPHVGCNDEINSFVSDGNKVDWLVNKGDPFCNFSSG